MKAIIVVLVLFILGLLEISFWYTITEVLSKSNIVLVCLTIYSLVTALTFILFISFFRRKGFMDYKIPFYGMGLTILLEAPKLISLFFVLISLIVSLISNNVAFVILIVSCVISALIFLAIVHGMIWGRFNWKVKSLSLKFNKLPSDLKGIKIVQISDIHIGSFFGNTKQVEKAVNMINALNPDYILFTGDLVNNYADEVKPYLATLGKLKAKKGMYSILGNHDYGDYVKWTNKEDYALNLEKLITYHKEIGFTPLLNNKIQLSDKENSAYLLGVENWGAPPFKQYGDLGKTLEDIPTESFKLLMSHDPSHFDYEITKQTNIDLILSGHTHGMQFGFEFGKFRFSPVQFKYPKWAGLYQVKNQYLYVNRGFGYLGFPGRVGIWPEITEIVLD